MFKDLNIKKEISEMAQDKIICIVGKSGSGKTTLARALEAEGFNVIHSYTTRPRRYPEEWGHIFVSDPICLDEEGQLRKNTIAYTFFNNHHYWATLEQVKGATIYTVDPRGVEELREEVQNIPVLALYLKCSEEELRRRMKNRGDKDEKILERIIHDRTVFKEAEEQADYIIDGEKPVECIIEEVKRVIRIGTVQ